MVHTYVRRNKPPGYVSVKVKTKVVYAPKASCFVLAPEDCMNLAQFCALLMTVEKQLKNKKERDVLDDPVQQSKIKTKGSLNRGPYLF